MISWPAPFLPAVEPADPALGRLRLFDTGSGSMQEIGAGRDGGPVRMYVCGITPYDATHLGHAATYVTFDLVGRVLRDQGDQVSYCQNVTDIDDPLLERAAAIGMDWRDLAAAETALFREDMTALQVIPPDAYVGAVESIPSVVAVVAELVARGAAYRVPVTDGTAEYEGAADVYLDLSVAPPFGEVCHAERAWMLDVFAARGGDPDRAEKRDPLDPLLWRAARRGEPSWDGGPLGPGRPGWHVECTCIVHDVLGDGIDLQGGGSDLVFPHHEMCALTSAVVTGSRPFARAYVHQGMVGLDRAKMSKSKGNLVLVSRLRADGVDPMAIRLMLLRRHYRTDWDYSAQLLDDAERELATIRAALSVNTAVPAWPTVTELRERLRDDLDGAGALDAVARWCAQTLDEGGFDPAAPGVMARTLDALLGLRI